MGEWKETKIGELTELVTKGTTPSTLGGGFSSLGINFIKSESVNYDGRLDKSKFTFITEDTHNRLSRSQLKVDDILFSMAGVFLGKTGLVTEDILPANINQALAIIRINKEKAFPKFVNYFLKLKSTIDYVNNLSGQSAQPNINFQEIRSIGINIPPLPEQKAIASVLSSLDDKIDLLHRQNKTLESMAETLFRQWFVEGVGEDWKEGCLADIAKNIRNSAKVGSFQPAEKYVALEHIERRNIALKYHGSSIDVASNKYYFQKYDILFGKLRPYFHKVCFAPFTGICSTDILVVRPISSNWFCFCLFAFFQNDVVDYANLGSAGTRMPRTDWSTLSQYPISIPDEVTLSSFNELVLPSIEKIQENVIQMTTLEKIRDTLLPKLMSGEVRVQCEAVA